MCIQYRVDRDSKVLRIQASGLVTDEDLASCVGAIVTDAEILPGMDVIVDLRDLHETILSRAGIERAMRILVELGQLVRNNRLAVVERRRDERRASPIDILSSRFTTVLRNCLDLEDALNLLGIRTEVLGSEAPASNGA